MEQYTEILVCAMHEESNGDRSLADDGSDTERSTDYYDVCVITHYSDGTTEPVDESENIDTYSEALLHLQRLEKIHSPCNVEYL